MTYRKSIEIDGVAHGNTPIPLGAKLGRMIFSSAIAGNNPETGEIPDDPSEQVKLVFQNVRSFMEVAGGSTEHIGKVTVLVQDESIRDIVNEEWVKMFPNPESRPARHSKVTQLRQGAVVQLEIIAVLPE